MNQLRKPLITLVGGLLMIVGAVLLIVPGPAFLLLPVGLGLLSLEYPWARQLLKRFQRSMSRSAAKVDAWIAARRR